MKDPKNLQIAYIGGGSRAWARVLMTDLALEPGLSGTVKLYDIDYEAAVENANMGNTLLYRDDAVGKWRYEAYHTIEKVLTGADFVVISILPGTFEEMRSDVHAPEKYGIYQSVGDTVGLGGTLRAMRTIPMYVEFAKAIREYCPGAWVINYTNPMTLCVRTLYEVFPEVKAIGCCHEVFDTQTDFTDMLRTMRGIEGAGIHNIKINVMGINHFTWIDKASYKGMDLMPLFAEAADKFYDVGYEREENKHWRNSVFRNANRVKFDLFKRYGMIPCAGDRHLAEFTPPQWYLKTPEMAESWGFALTSIDWRIEDREEAEKKRRAIIDGKESFVLEPTGEEGVLQMKALLGLGDYVTNVNYPNYGQMDKIPYGAVVETNALLSCNSVAPIYAGGLPDEVNNLVMRHVYNQETILRASIDKDLKRAFNAFINDPQCILTLDDANELFITMVNNTKKYLDGWDLEVKL